MEFLESFLTAPGMAYFMPRESRILLFVVFIVIPILITIVIPLLSGIQQYKQTGRIKDLLWTTFLPPILLFLSFFVIVIVDSVLKFFGF